MAENETINEVVNVTPDDVIYDYFVFNGKKIVVLKNEQFEEFFEQTNPSDAKEHKKRIMLGELYSKDDSDYIFPLEQKEYDEALEYYISLKSCLLEVVDDE